MDVILGPVGGGTIMVSSYVQSLAPVPTRRRLRGVTVLGGKCRARLGQWLWSLVPEPPPPSSPDIRSPCSQPADELGSLQKVTLQRKVARQLRSKSACGPHGPKFERSSSELSAVRQLNTLSLVAGKLSRSVAMSNSRPSTFIRTNFECRRSFEHYGPC